MSAHKVQSFYVLEYVLVLVTMFLLIVMIISVLICRLMH
jgi:hypothetical protein